METLDRSVWVGVDENGLGPRLGPLVATACSLAAPAALDVSDIASVASKLGIGDSKATSGFGAMAHAEGLALAIVGRSGAIPSDADAVLDGLALGGRARLAAPCPEGTRPQCWSPLAVPAFGGDVERGRAMLRGLAERGVEVVRVRSAVLCARTFNDAIERRGSKLDVDLELFEELLLDARSASAVELDAICGMVGGIRRYTPRLVRIDKSAVRVVEETKKLASYRVEGLGTVRFEVDADASHVAVALASMVGKYVRELAMARQNAFYRALDASLPAVSGYYDPVTARFVDASRLLRERRGIDPRCFERNG